VKGGGEGQGTTKADAAGRGGAIWGIFREGHIRRLKIEHALKKGEEFKRRQERKKKKDSSRLVFWVIRRSKKGRTLKSWHSEGEKNGAEKKPPEAHKNYAARTWPTRRR